jgi:uncharacterized protein
MDISLLTANLLTPAVLFFLLGIVAVIVKSDLELPQPIPKFISLYLLLAIGFKGGIELNKSGLNPTVALTLAAAIVMSIIVPIASFAILRRRFSPADAAATAAAYGSISAVTYVTAETFLTSQGAPPSGYMVAIMALMESPAIIIGLILARRAGVGNAHAFKPSELLREAFFNGSVLLLLGSMLIGVLTGERGARALSPFTGENFQGFLSLFLLDLGMSSARRIGDLRKFGLFPFAFAIGMPLLTAAFGIGISRLIQLPPSDALIFTVLCASASYIAVPAAMRISLPEANPGLFIPMALTITFPFNVAFGIPVYLGIIRYFWGQ